ncbi:MAG TPA: hypothetical protein VL475_05620, partial [Planctomycetaceae bacterium]|nr:hypothetical protein [Planctomycetaceae bacterium]
GKTKTIAVDLTGLVAGDDCRVRIVTSMEIYWDAAFFSVDEEPAPIELRELPLVSADLHFRGYSRRVPHAQHGPEFYDYARVSTETRWPPLEGHYTRYGDVLPLLSESDDRLVVLAQGDEMSLEFAAPQENPPAGWKRDFLLYNVGWDKDADLNTVYGQSVEPLPFRAMERYPFPEGVTSPDNPAYQEYLQQYQTRATSQQRFWKRICRFERDGSGARE